MLEQIFLKVTQMSQAAGLLILAVLFMRMLFRGFPKYISYMLWSVVLLRLLCPITLKSAYSPVPDYDSFFYGYTSVQSAFGQTAAEQVVPEQAASEAEEVPEQSGAPALEGEGKKDGNGPEARQHAVLPFPAGINRTDKEASLWVRFGTAGKYVWLAGVVILFLYGAVSFVRIRRRVSAAAPLRGNIYVTDAGLSPFVMGVFRPRIYLPEGLNRRERKYIILHERLHIRRLDHLVKPLAFAALCLHWFNPLVWLAFSLFCRDMEMSCDEAVIRKMGKEIRADYAASLLALSTRKYPVRGIPVEFGEGDIKGRIQNLASLRKRKKTVLTAALAGACVFLLCAAYLAFTRRTPEAESTGRETAGSEEESVGPETAEPEAEAAAFRPELLPDITEQYRTHTGDPSNLYYIDENHVLWGSGRNDFGQLGQGTRDDKFHSTAVKIAEDVIHVDHSQKGFVIYLTRDHRLYGIGNAGGGALQQYETFDGNRYVNDENCFVSEPYLLMEHVKYACCGRDDIACIAEDDSVWIWGTVWCDGNTLLAPWVPDQVSFIKEPKKVLENAALVTGGWWNHAALLRDGTVWTWGYNSSGNCGISDFGGVSEPVKVAEDVVMVWTDLAVDNYPQPDAADIAMGWTGKKTYREDYEDITEFDGVYPRFLNNTVILKTDGSHWVCGENVGEQERTVHGEEADYSVVCTGDFLPCE